LFNTGPQGDKGEQGDKGDKGKQGADGLNLKTLICDNVITEDTSGNVVFGVSFSPPPVVTMTVIDTTGTNHTCRIDPSTATGFSWHISPAPDVGFGWMAVGNLGA
jgi:hypothetical protein